MQNERSTYNGMASSSKKRIMIAMSGGIDSSACALVLKQQGHTIAGITMDLGDYGMVHTSEGATIAAPVAARKVCDHLGIPHHTLRCSHRLHKSVISPFIGQYTRGKTPNPCVMCNERLKFPYLLAQAKKRGYDYIATGHYAHLEHTDSGPLLKKPADDKKDQTYFLYRVPRHIFSSVVFPLADMTKQRARALIRYHHLPIVYTHESQDICFIPHNDYRAFLATAVTTRVPGPIRDTSGRILGRHNGIIHYTIGQRKGLGIATGHPLYVVRIDSSTNTVVVGRKNELYSSGLIAVNLNLLCSELPQRLHAKIRYAHTPAAATCTVDKDTIALRFDSRQRAVTPGQSVVLYDNDRVLGGGYIKKPLG